MVRIGLFEKNHLLNIKTLNINGIYTRINLVVSCQLVDSKKLNLNPCSCEFTK